MQSGKRLNRVKFWVMNISGEDCHSSLSEKAAYMPCF